MDIFENCRICLREINHEPIKMTRLIMRFLEQFLQLPNVTKPYPTDKAKQNLCAPCFNRTSEFQDFLEQCRDSDEFWKAQFEDFKEASIDKQSTYEQTELLALAEDSNSLEADTTVSTTEVKRPIYTQHENEKPIQPSQVEEEHNKKRIQINNIDLTCWPDDANNDDNIHTNITHVNEEIIEYEYQLEEDEEVKIEENRTIDDSVNSDICGVDYRSFTYEKIETENSSENTMMHESGEEFIEEQSESKKNSFLMTSTIDENGKVKMSYECQQCGKCFSRIYDIESHYNIHNGVKPFTCNVCGKSFRQKNILTTHQALHFGKKVECAECGKKFARRSQLILHYRMHRDEKPFVCNFDGCQAAFRQRKQLIDHSFIHTGEKNFQCATCTKSFHTRKRLQDHLYKVHSQHRYHCELCEKTFLKPHMLKHHMTTAHNVELADVSHLKTLVEVVKPIKKSSKQTNSN